MARFSYEPEEFGTEVVAPSGYYVPIGQEITEWHGRRLLYVVGDYYIEASCCGVGSGNYLRVEGYVVGDEVPETGGASGRVEIETVEDDGEKAAIRGLLSEKHPGATIEFR